MGVWMVMHWAFNIYGRTTVSGKYMCVCVFMYFTAISIIQLCQPVNGVSDSIILCIV